MDYFQGMKRLPGLPMGRAAYSDRMAYIGAELSRLVYEPFTSDADLTGLLHKLGKCSNDTERREILAAWSSHLQSHACGLEGGIRSILQENNFEPINFYDVAETQALLAQMDGGGGQKVLVLCFRGTEINAWDIITDLRFPLMPAGNEGRVHTGFKRAFENVRTQIENDLLQKPKLPLYIFGHSLGGALALICTRELNPDGDGATYVYGCPRTGDQPYFRRVKTPIYRLEMGGDPVPMVPFGYGFGACLALLRLIPLNGTLQLARWLRNKVLGYYHTGFRVFIKHAPNEPDANDLGFRRMRVDFSANIFWRMQSIWRAWISVLPDIKGVAGFHSVRLYSDMLQAHMLRRNLGLLQAPGRTVTAPETDLAATAGATATEEPAPKKKSTPRKKKSTPRKQPARRRQTESEPSD
ncbi:lipase family protein [Microbulbifer sediminum]|uniref:lipase family protein n=1 Tax=Microbulbifer sediminum TaxID=2904250 RepID=UPI001F4393C8